MIAIGFHYEDGLAEFMLKYYSPQGVNFGGSLGGHSHLLVLLVNEN